MKLPIFRPNRLANWCALSVLGLAASGPAPVQADSLAPATAPTPGRAATSLPVPSVVPPWISVRFGEAGRITVEWAGGTLQDATLVVGPWLTVTGARSPLTVVPADVQRYYRLEPPPVVPPNPDPDRLVWVPPGTFPMGSPASEPGRDPDEGPPTEVTLTRGFWLGRQEVTQRDYLATMEINPSAFPGDLDLPVENVTWSDATNYCVRWTAREGTAGRLPAGYEYRLPTEAQWEYACRAGTTTATAFGDSLSSTQANFDGNSPYNGGAFGPAIPRTTKVGSYAPNAWGLQDMHGNVWEWCQDWYAAYPGGSVTDPEGPASGSSRVMRGGRWGDLGQYCRSANRGRNDPDGPSSHLGFRVALVKVR